LLSAADAVLAGRDWAPSAGPGSLPKWAWLNEDLAMESRFSNYLKANCLAAVFVSRSGEMIARTAGMPGGAGEEIAALVMRIWGKNRTRDSARYIRRGSSGIQVLLYVVHLDSSLMVGLIFSGETPPHRAQAVVAELQQIIYCRSQEISADDQEPLEVNRQVSAKVSADLPDEELESLDARLLELLESAPAPDPFKFNAHEEDSWQLDQELLLKDLGDLSLPARQDQQKIGSVKAGESVCSEPTQGTSAAQARESDQIPLPPAASQHIKIDGDLSEKRQVFTCVLVPLLPEYQMEGDLAVHLRSWALSFSELSGWKSIDLQIAPEVLQWTLDAPAAASPGSLVRTIRRQSSQEILSRFPNINCGAEGDFWAPGFLIVRGAAPPAPPMIQDFIRQTRLRQGMAPPE